MKFLKKLFGPSKLDKELLAAARNGNVEEVKRLLDAGADKETKDQSECTSLHLAASSGHKEPK